MKNLLSLLCGVLLLSGAGCIKPAVNSTGVQTSSVTPNVTDFSLSAPASFAPGSVVTVTCTAPKLADGSYTLMYNIEGMTYGGTAANASVAFKAGKGTFTTPNLTSNGCVTVTTTSLQNVANLSTVPLTAKVSFCDSSGVMDAMRNNEKFYATHVTCTLSNSSLDIEATVFDTPGPYDPGRTIELTMQNFSQSPKTVSFTANDYTIGSARYTSSTNTQYVAYGTISITATSPIVSGNFSFTTQDSSKFHGTFSVKAP